MAESVVLPTDAYDEWSAAEPAGRLAPLLHAWWRLPGAPLATRGPAGEPAPAALTRTGYADVIVELRHEMLRAARDLPSDRGMVGDEGLVRIVAWRVPLLVAALDDPDDLLTALWRETRLLGLVAHGAVTPLGRALIDGDDAALTAAAHDLLPPAVSTALFQADLTAVVPGTPATSLAMLLDAAADRESRGGAAIWRFSPASIRRAFDAGTRQAELLDGLRGFASGGALPQPLEYLVADIARRHGQLRVRTVACVIRGNDEALLAEIAAVRSLAPLKLALLAPTVLASGKPLNETLAALRAAGYAPVGESRDGTPVVERATRRRATGPRPRGAVGVPRTRPSTVAAEPADPLAVATALLSGPPASVNEPASVHEPASVDVASEGPAGGEDDTESVISQYAPQLSGAEQRILSHAVEHGARVKIHYTNAQGNPSTRVIEPLGLYGHVVEAWCHLREDERMFALERIDAVSPA
jgi:hypothetical protein